MGDSHFLERLRVRIVGRVHRVCDERFDAQRGIETARNVDAAELADVLDLRGYEGDDELYAGTPSLLFDALHSPLSDMDRSQTTYIDVGCGKGRMLIQASEAGFHSVIGVEFAESLAKMARENLQSVLGHGQGRWRIEGADARTYRYPDGALALFLYNPFDPPVFERFLSNLCADLAERPRDVRLIYNHTLCADLLDAQPAFERMSYPGAKQLYASILNPHPFGAWRYIGHKS
jgi:SAM-dependent methyltransferase